MHLSSPCQTFLLWLCTFNLNVITSLLFLTLAILVWCLAASESHPGITKGTGGFGFFVAFLAFYAISFAVTWAVFIRQRDDNLVGV